MKTIKKLSRDEKKMINGGATQIQIEACGGEQFVCFMGGGRWGCWLKPGGKCYAPMLLKKNMESLIY